jgi:hypothetical protein
MLGLRPYDPTRVCLRTCLHNLQLRHWVQIQFKVAVVVWMTILALYTPALASAALGATVLVLVSVTIFGALVAITGVAMSSCPGVTGRRGYGIELAGLCSMLVGPSVYFVTQIVISASIPHGWDERGAFVAALWVIVSAVLSRAAIVGHHWRQMKKRIA